MYGTVSKMRLVPGSEPFLMAQLEAMRGHREEGFVSSTIYRSDDDPLELWVAVVFESREAYRANAESETQDVVYRRMRSALEADPEWHDGEVILDVRADPA